ncbi:MAG: transcriptional regulator [Gammaproteobacteria bacterium]|nr:transcriptional regulator [Gammaproteobacteria bacterium]
MVNIDIAKKPATKDWSNPYIIYRLNSVGWSLRKLSSHHGYADDSLKQCLCRRWLKAERIIANVLDVHPKEIWPSRYNSDGTRAPKHAIQSVSANHQGAI